MTGKDRQKLNDEASLFTAKLDVHVGEWFKAPPGYVLGLAPYVGSAKEVYLNPAAFDGYCEEDVATGQLVYWFRRKPRPEGLPE